MGAFHDFKAAAAGDDELVVAKNIRRADLDQEPPAPTESFAGRDDQKLIDDITGSIAAADHAGVCLLRDIVFKRMESGDLSSLLALRLLRACDARAIAIERAR